MANETIALVDKINPLLKDAGWTYTNRRIDVTRICSKRAAERILAAGFSVDVLVGTPCKEACDGA